MTSHSKAIFSSPWWQTLSGLINLSSTRFITLVVTLISTTVVARSLGPTEYGLLVWITSIYAYLMIGAEFGSRTIVMSEASALKSCAPLMSSYLRFRILSGIMFFAVGMCILNFYDSSLLGLGFGVFITLMASPFLFDWALMVQGSYFLAGATLTIRACAYLLAVATARILNMLSLSFVAVAFPLSWFVAAFSSYLFYRKSYSPSHIQIDPVDMTPKFLRSGLYVVGSSFVSQTFQNADLIWIGLFHSASETGTYGLAATLVTAGSLFGNALGQVALSKYGVYKNNQEQLLPQFRKDMWLTLSLASTVSIGCAVCGPIFVPIIFGIRFAESATLLLAFIPYLFLQHGFIVIYSVFLSVNLERQTLSALTFAAIAFPLVFMLVAPSENMALYALAKGGLLEATLILMVLSAPQNIKKPLLLAIAPNLIFGLLSFVLVYTCLL